MSERTALVTGGCGFVGRHFVRWLLNHDYRVTIVDNLATGLPLDAWPAHLRPTAAQRSRLTVHLVDLRDYVKTASADFDLVVHLAAVVGGRLTIEGDPLAVATDLAIDADLFNWVVRQKPLPRKVLYFSSSAAYPIDLQTAERNQPLAEDLIRFDGRMGVPDMTYGWAKLTGEFLAQYAANTYGLDVVTFRPFSGYGEDQDFTYPFPSIIRRVAQHESPIVVWGSGRQLRDFIYIDDAVEAVFASLPHLGRGDVLNLGSGVGTSFTDLAQLAGEVIGHTAEVVNDPSKPEGVFARVGDCTRMLGIYTPVVSLRDGIARVYEYQRSAGLIQSPVETR